MKSIKRLLLVLAVLMAGSPAFAEWYPGHFVMRLWLKTDNREPSYEARFRDMPVIVFNKDNGVSIKANYYDTVELIFSDLRKIGFDYLASVEGIDAENRPVIESIGAHEFAISGLKEGTVVTAVAVSGIEVYRSEAKDGERLEISLEGQAAGVYVITAGDASFKVAIH